MDKQITRTAEEQEAFEALVHSLSFMREIFKGNTFFEVAQGVERELLTRGYQIVKIEKIISLHEMIHEHDEERRKGSSLGFFD